MRLLIAPEAVNGLQSLGLPFQRSLAIGQGTGVTDTVDLLLQSESSYLVLVPDGSIMKLRKDKVWAIVEERK